MKAPVSIFHPNLKYVIVVTHHSFYEDRLEAQKLLKTD